MDSGEKKHQDVKKAIESKSPQSSQQKENQSTQKHTDTTANMYCNSSTERKRTSKPIWRQKQHMALCAAKAYSQSMNRSKSRQIWWQNCPQRHLEGSFETDKRHSGSSLCQVEPLRCYSTALHLPWPWGWRGDDTGMEVEPTSYLLQRRQGDVEVAHSCLRKALGSLVLFQETETSTWLLTIVSDLVI